MEKTYSNQPANDVAVDGSAAHAVQQASQAFSVVDPATGKRRTVREMTDAELMRYHSEFSNRAKNQIQQTLSLLSTVVRDINDPKLNGVVNMLEQTRQASGFVMVMEYEQNRRQNTLALVTG